MQSKLKPQTRIKSSRANKNQKLYTCKNVWFSVRKVLEKLETTLLIQ